MMKRSKRCSIYIITVVTSSLVAAAAIELKTTRNPNPNLSSRHFFNFPNTITAIVRSSRALYTIGSNVVDYNFSLCRLSPNSDDYNHTRSEVHLRSAKRVLKLCEANGGFYVKAGQFVASLRLRQLPKEYSSILSSLQDQVKVPCEFESIKQVIVRNLGVDLLSDVFATFDEQPIAAASIAQVHRALLVKVDDDLHHEEVAIKVQYPGLEHQMRVDIATMSIISKFLSWLFPEYRFTWVVNEFSKSIAAELDFVQEAMNSERTANHFRHNNGVKVPSVFWEFTTSQVLTMQFIKGNKIDDVQFLKEKKINPVEVAKALAEVFAEMVFVTGFLHGDLHPGNILVSPQGPNGFSIVVLDHGRYRELDEKLRINYCRLWKAIILSDRKKIEQIGEELGVGKKNARYIPVMFTGKTIDRKLGVMGKTMSDEEKRILNKELKSLKMEDISSFIESLPPDFLAILRTDGLLKSMIKKLGATERVRLVAYAKYALYGGLTSKQNCVDKYICVVKMKANVKYLELRFLIGVLEILSWMEDTRQSLVNTIGKIICSFTHFCFRKRRQVVQ